MREARPYQLQAKRDAYTAWREGGKNIMLVMATGCHAKGSPILMYNGIVRPVESIEPGDHLMGFQGFSRTVLSCIKGRGEMCRVIPTKGEPFEVNLDHILTLVHTETDRIIDISVREWLNLLPFQKHCLKLFREATNFNPAGSLPMPAYLLGILLGDGCLRAKPPSVTSNDIEIVEYLQMVARFGFDGLDLPKRDHAERTDTYAFSSGNTGPRVNELTDELHKLGLWNTDSGSKFIPAPYKVASRKQRLDILAGLMDTDGSLTGPSGYDYISKSEQLAKDVAFVARSLGFAAYIKPTLRTGFNTTGIYFRVSISGDVAQIPVLIPRKKASPRRQKKNVLRTGFKVELLGEGDYYGFELDGDKRYLMGDFTVTHNTGKTHVASTIIADVTERTGKKALFLAQRSELIQQSFDAFRAHGLKPAVEMANETHFGKMFDVNVVIGSVQSVAQKKRLAKFNPEEYALVVIDEAHHATAATYRRIVDHFSETRTLGLTATPYRSDKVGLKNVFDRVAFQYPIQQGIEEGYLCPVRSKSVEVQALHLERVRVVKGEFDEAEISSLLLEEETLQQMVVPTIELTRDRPTIVFCENVEHAKAIGECFNRALDLAHGAVVVYGAMSADDRRVALDRFKTGRSQYCVNVNVLTEGFDHPPTSAIALFRPMKALGQLVQCVGRGTRTAEGKVDCIAEGQRVLTDRGLIPIEQVSLDMRVWDGCEFVSHCGTVFHEEQEVITYAGLTATPDHKVWTDQGWQNLQRCSDEHIPIRVTGVSGAALRETDGYARGGRQASWPPIRTRRMLGMRRDLFQRNVFSYSRKGRVSQMWKSAKRSKVASGPGHQRKTEVYEPEGSRLCSVRPARNSIQIHVPDRYGSMGPRESGVKAAFANRSQGQRRPLRAWQPPVFNPTTESSSYEQSDDQREASQISPKIPAHSIRRWHTEGHVRPRYDPCSDHRTFRPTLAQTKRRVWDILNAGPLHRFTVEGLLVSNCLVLDFTNVGDTVETVNVLDVLDGTMIDRATKKKAKEYANTEDAMTALKRAKYDMANLAKIHARMTAVYRATGSSLMDLLGIGRARGLFGGEAVTHKQRALLQRFGVEVEQDFEKGEAMRLIDAVIKRQKAGLCTIKQAKILSQHGVSNAWDLDFNDAKIRIAQIVNR